MTRSTPKPSGPDKSRPRGPKARARISDREQAEFAAGHLRDSSLPAYESGLLGDLVKDAVADPGLRKAVLDYYRFLRFDRSKGRAGTRREDE